MQVEFICLEIMDFNTREGIHISGVRAWYLDPDTRNEHLLGCKPQHIWFTNEQVNQFGINGLGKYEVTVNLRGKVTNLKKI